MSKLKTYRVQLALDFSQICKQFSIQSNDCDRKIIDFSKLKKKKSIDEIIARVDKSGIFDNYEEA